MKSIKELKELSREYFNALRSGKSFDVQKPPTIKAEEWITSNTPTIEKELIQGGRCELVIQKDQIDSRSFGAILDRLTGHGFNVSYQSHNAFFIITIYLP